MNQNFRRSVRLSLSAIALVAVASFATRATAQVDVTAPGNPAFGVVATQGGNSAIATAGTVAATNNFPAGEPPAAAFDNLFAGPPAVPGATKYLNFARLNTGLIVTPGNSLVTGLRLYAANDAAERDPLTYTLEGTNDANPSTALGGAWSPISSGDTGLGTNPGRFLPGTSVAFANLNAYTSYRLLFPTVRGPAGNSMQVGEVELLGVAIPEPATSVLLGGAALGLVALRARGRRR